MLTLMDVFLQCCCPPTFFPLSPVRPHHHHHHHPHANTQTRLPRHVSCCLLHCACGQRVGCTAMLTCDGVCCLVCFRRQRGWGTHAVPARDQDVSQLHTPVAARCQARGTPRALALVWVCLGAANHGGTKTRARVFVGRKSCQKGAAPICGCGAVGGERGGRRVVRYMCCAPLYELVSMCLLCGLLCPPCTFFHDRSGTGE